MKTNIPKMEVQLAQWRLKIDLLAGTVHGIGTPREYDALVYIDELKALHAIARSALNEFRAATGADRQRLQPALMSAWGELKAALEDVDL